MSVKSVVDIDINDADFKAFTEAFTAYQKQLAKTPEAWKEANKEIKNSGKNFKDLTSSLGVQTAAMQRQAALNKDVAESSKQSAFHWSTISNKSKTFAADIKSVTTNLIKWSGIAGLAGIGSLGGALFGLDRLGLVAAAGRRSAQGLGTSFGGQQAFGNVFGRAVDANAVLGGIAGAKGNLGSAGAAALFSLGINPNEGDTTDTAVKALEKARALAQATPDNQLGIQHSARGLGELGLSVEDLRRLKAMSNQEFDSYKGDFAKRKGQFEPGDPALKAWQNFTIQLDAAGKKLETGLIAGLSKLTGPLGDLADGLSDAVKALLDSDGFKDIIITITTGLKTFADYVKTDAFKQDIKSFTEGLSDLAKIIVKAVKWILDVFPQNSLSPADPKNGSDAIGKWSSDALRWMGILPKNPATPPVTVGLNPASAPAIGAVSKDIQMLFDLTKRLEASPDINGKPQISPAGAIGEHQIMPATGAALGYSVEDLKDPVKNAEAARKLLQELSTRYNGNIAEILADYNGGPNAVSIYRKGGIPGLDAWTNSSGQHPYSETARYIERSGVQVKIENNTGGNAQVSINQMAAPALNIPQ